MAWVRRRNEELREEGHLPAFSVTQVIKPSCPTEGNKCITFMQLCWGWFLCFFICMWKRSCYTGFEPTAHPPLVLCSGFDCTMHWVFIDIFHLTRFNQFSLFWHSEGTNHSSTVYQTMIFFFPCHWVRVPLAFLLYPLKEICIQGASSRTPFLSKLHIFFFITVLSPARFLN